MRPPVRRSAAVVLSLALVAQSLPALAGSSPDPLKEAAAAERSGDWKRAADALARALDAKPSSQLALRYATALEKAGRLVDAIVQLEKLEKEKGAVAATASRRVEELLRRCPRLTIEIDDVPGLVVTLDGREVAREKLGAPHLIDPGTHHVTAARPGREPSRAEVVLRAGEKQTVHLEAPRARKASLPDEGERPDASRGLSTRTLGWVSVGVGGAAIVAGGWFAWQAKQQRDTISSACPGDVCPPEHAGLVSTGKRNADAATIALAAGGAGVVLGIVLLSIAAPADGAPQSARPGPSVHPWVGLGDVGVSGRF